MFTWQNLRKYLYHLLSTTIRVLGTRRCNFGFIEVNILWSDALLDTNSVVEHMLERACALSSTCWNEPVPCRSHVGTSLCLVEHMLERACALSISCWNEPVPCRAHVGTSLCLVEHMLERACALLSTCWNEPVPCRACVGASLCLVEHMLERACESLVVPHVAAWDAFNVSVRR